MKSIQLVGVAMNKINLSTNIANRLENGSQQLYANGQNLIDLLSEIENNHENLKGILLTDQGCLQQHLRYFVNNIHIQQSEVEDYIISDNDEIYIISPMSGG